MFQFCRDEISFTSESTLCFHSYSFLGKIIYMKNKIGRWFILSSIISLLFLSCASSAKSGNEIDYSDVRNWAYFKEGEEKPVDLFIIAPTVDMGMNGNSNMDMDDERTKSNFVGALNMERGIYDDVATMYSPFYRQMTFPIYQERKAESGESLALAYGDIEDAFCYYIENLNDDRPFILAGFSQGAELALMLLENHFDDEEIRQNLVAAYLIGWKVTEDDLINYPHLRMAEKEDDTGVIISFNSESVETEDSIIVPEGTKTFGINPLSWQTDSTVAEKALNKGACFTDYSGNVILEVAELTGCYLDKERGTLKITDISTDDERYQSPLFPNGVYHLYDYQFFFRNLEENVQVRTDAYLEKAI